MKKTNRYLLMLLIILLLIIMIRIVSPIMGNEITTILTTATTVIGIFSVFIEMKRSADIAECEFIFNLQKQFDDNPKIQKFYEQLDNDFANGVKINDSIKRTEIVSYLTFFEMMCNLIIKNVISIEDIDDLYAYPFFIAVNNKTIQDIELRKYKSYYQNIYKIYSKWYQYRKLKKNEIPYEKNKLV